MHNLMIDPKVDIQENDILELSPELLNTLLKDHTLSTEDKQVNIFWATDNYADKGAGFQYKDQITIESITGENGDIIVPRALKSRATQQQRSREMAEVFTPSWICNKQNNLVDNAWFGRENVFNTEVDNPDGYHSWIVNEEPIIFPEGKTWMEYVKNNCLEITCGEAPYIVSRYDTVSGEYIPIERRIGLLDRKLRVVNENVLTYNEWIEAARIAFQSTYGYEWQGDNIVLAREALLYTFIDYFHNKFGKNPDLNLLLEIAEIISWNIWQMDGLKCVIPNSCVKVPDKKAPQLSLFNEEQEEPTLFDCPGCKKKDIKQHSGVYCKIMDWETGKPILFVSLINEDKNGKSKN